MTQTDEDLLAKELAKIGALGGRIGGGNAYESSGGALGAGWAARLLPNNSAEFTIELRTAPVAVLKTVFGIMEREGQIIEDPEPAGELPSISAIIGSGFLNLNPALVRVQVEPIAEDCTRISVNGVAKEGLIKQRGGEKAAKRIVDLLTQAFSISE